MCSLVRTSLADTLLLCFPLTLVLFFRSERELVQDVTDFVRSNGDSLRNPRELARIFHGLHAPSASSQSRSADSAARFAARGDANAAATSSAPAISPWFGCTAWGRHKSVPFPDVLRHCEQILQEYKLSAGSRMRAKREELDRKRESKRQKLAAAPPPPMLAPLARTASAASAAVAAASHSADGFAAAGALPSTASLAAAAAAAAAPAAADEILIAASDDEEEEAEE